MVDFAGLGWWLDLVILSIFSNWNVSIFCDSTSGSTGDSRPLCTLRTSSGNESVCLFFSFLSLSLQKNLIIL